MKRVENCTFVVVANGSPDSPPASGVRDWLVRHARSVTAIFHPLNPDDPPVHHVSTFLEGELVSQRAIERPSRPPATYLLDAITPIVRPRADAWLAFSNLSALHGIARRRARLVDRVAYWAVDFVPDRFGAGAPLSRAYDVVDRLAATRADLRVELTAAARDGRADRLDLGEDAAPTHVAPVGIWLDRVEQVPESGWRERRVVFIGHLVPRQGVATLIEAVALVPDVALDIAGRGPEEERLRALAGRLGIADRVRFLGFLSDHRDVERLLATASVAAAPYATDVESFTRYADPSKLRSYTGAGLPVVTTDVPPNAHELAEHAGAIVADYNARSIADAISKILRSEDDWKERRTAALEYSRAFDWGHIVPAALAALGFAA